MEMIQNCTYLQHAVVPHVSVSRSRCQETHDGSTVDLHHQYIERILFAMDTTPVTLILTLKTASHGGSDTVEVHRQGRGCDLYARLVQEEGEGDGCGHVRMVREVSVRGVPALPNWSYEESDVEIDFVGIHHHNNHAYNKQRDTASIYCSGTLH